MSTVVMKQDDRSAVYGVLASCGAFTLWGLSVIFFAFQVHIPSEEILAHRIIWTVAFVGLYLLWQNRAGEVRDVLCDRRLVLILFLCSLLIGTNWFLFVWAVSVDRILETSYGYFINPLMMIALGYVVLKETLSKAQKFAVGLVMIAVAIQATLLDTFPWVALSISITFALYGLIKKQLKVGVNLGLFVEALLLLPIALFYWGYLTNEGISHFGGSISDTILLLLNGPVTAIPLLLFAYATRRLRYSTIGLTQAITPSISFLLAVFMYGEPMNMIKLASFVIIWIALAVFIRDLWSKRQIQ